MVLQQLMQSEVERMAREESEREAKRKEEEEKKASADGDTGDADGDGDATAAAAPAEPVFEYDASTSSTRHLASIYNHHEAGDDDDGLDEAMRQWLRTVEMQLRQQQLDPPTIRQVLRGLTAGGEEARTAEMSIESVIRLPPRPSRHRADASQALRKLGIDDLRVGMLVVVSRSAAGAAGASSSRGSSSRRPSAASIDRGMMGGLTRSGGKSSSTSSSSSKSSGWVAGMAPVLGRVGLVQSVDAAAKAVLVAVPFAEASMLAAWWMPVAWLRAVDDPAERQRFVGLGRLGKVQRRLEDADNSLACMYARRAVLSLLAHAPISFATEGQGGGAVLDAFEVLRISSFDTALPAVLTGRFNRRLEEKVDEAMSVSGASVAMVEATVVERCQQLLASTTAMTRHTKTVEKQLGMWPPCRPRTRWLVL